MNDSSDDDIQPKIPQNLQDIEEGKGSDDSDDMPQ